MALYGLDLLTYNRNFYINNRSRFKTTLGALLSLLLIIILIPVSFFLSYDFLFFQNPTIQAYSLQTIPENLMNPVKFMFTYPKDLNDKIVFYIMNSDSDINSKKLIANFKKCNEAEYFYFKSNEIKNNTLEYLCGNLTLNHEIYILKCQNLLNNPDFENPGTCKYPYDSNFIDLTTYFDFNSLDSTLVNDPVVENTLSAGFQNYTKLFILCTANVLNNDVGLFNKDVKVFTFNDIFDIYQDIIITDPYFHIIINTKYFYMEINKSYIKFPDILSRVIAIAKLVYMIFYIVNINDFYYCKYFLNLILENDLENFKLLYLRDAVKIDPKLNETMDLKQDILNSFTMLNYFFSFLPFSNSLNKNKFNTISKLIKYQISLDRLVDDYPSLNEIENFHDSNSLSMRMLIKLDIFANERTFYINRNKKLNTKSGIILTYIFFALWIPISIIFGYDFAMRINPNIRIYDRSSFNVENKPINFKPDVPIMLELSKSLYEYTLLVSLNNTQDDGYYPIDYHYCNETEYLSFNKTKPMDTTITYMCFNSNKFSGNYYEDPIEHFEVYLFTCDYIPNEIHKKKCLNRKLDKGKEYFLAINFAFTKFVNSYDDFIVNDIKYYERPIVYGVTGATFKLVIQPYIVINDIDIFFSSPQTYYKTAIFQPEYYERDHNDARILDINYTYKYYNNIIDREYKKLPKTLAEIFSIISITKIILIMINSFISNYYFHSFFVSSITTDNNDFKKKFKKEMDKYNLNENNNSIVELMESNNINTNQSKKINNYVSNERNNSNNEFTLKNHLKFTLFSLCFKKRVEVVKHKIITEVLTDELHCEKILLNKMNSTNSNFIQNFDILSKNKNLYINGLSLFKTWIGGLLSIVYLGLVLLFMYLFGSEFWLRQNPTLEVLSKFDKSIEKGEVNQNISVMLGYPKELKNSFRIGKYNLGDFLLNQNILCDENLFNNFNTGKNSELEYNCFKDQKPIVLTYLLCSDIEDPTCNTSEINLEKKFKFTYEVNYTKLLKNNTNNFFEEKTRSLEFNNQFWGLGLNIFYMEKVIFIDDQGWLFSDKSIYSYVTYESRICGYNFKLDDYRKNNRDTVVDPDQTIVLKRTFMKFPEMLARVFSILSIIRLLIVITYTYISEYLFIKYFIHKYFAKTDISKLNASIVSAMEKKLSKIILKLDKKSVLEEEVISIDRLVKIMNLKNYLKFILVGWFSKSEEMIIFKIVYEDFIEFLSMEKIVTNNINKRLVLNNEISS